MFPSVNFVDKIRSRSSIDQSRVFFIKGYTLKLKKVRSIAELTLVKGIMNSTAL